MKQKPQQEEEDDEEQDDFGSQVSLNSSTQENDAYTNGKSGSMDRFGVVMTIRKTRNGSGQSGDFVTMTNFFNEKRYVFCTLVSRNTIVVLVFKERSFPVRCRTKQTKLEGSNFLKWASIALTSPVLPICLRIARARPTKILMAITFPKKSFGF